MAFVCRLSDGYQLFLRLDIGDRTKFVLVKEPKLQEWHQTIEVNATYSIKCLHSENIHIVSTRDLLNTMQNIASDIIRCYVFHLFVVFNMCWSVTSYVMYYLPIYSPDAFLRGWS